jgi:hypothetical protein
MNPTYYHEAWLLSVPDRWYDWEAMCRGRGIGSE